MTLEEIMQNIQNLKTQQQRCAELVTKFTQEQYIIQGAINAYSQMAANIEYAAKKDALKAEKKKAENREKTRRSRARKKTQPAPVTSITEDNAEAA